jgi:hypothetical protein
LVRFKAPVLPFLVLLLTAAMQNESENENEEEEQGAWNMD